MLLYLHWHSATRISVQLVCVWQQERGQVLLVYTLCAKYSIPVNRLKAPVSVCCFGTISKIIMHETSQGLSRALYTTN